VINYDSGDRNRSTVYSSCLRAANRPLEIHEKGGGLNLTLRSLSYTSCRLLLTPAGGRRDLIVLLDIHVRGGAQFNPMLPSTFRLYFL
jgi:hypothetical protein